MFGSSKLIFLKSKFYLTWQLIMKFNFWFQRVIYCSFLSKSWIFLLKCVEFIKNKQNLTFIIYLLLSFNKNSVTRKIDCIKQKLNISYRFYVIGKIDILELNFEQNFKNIYFIDKSRFCPIFDTWSKICNAKKYNRSNN